MQVGLSQVSKHVRQVYIHVTMHVRSSQVRGHVFQHVSGQVAKHVLGQVSAHVPHVGARGTTRLQY